MRTGARAFRIHLAREDRLSGSYRAAAALAVGAIALRAFGLPPIDLHSPLHRAGIMDPLCGGTRAALALAHGDPDLAWRYNPLVPFLAVAICGLLVRWCWGRATGRWIAVDLIDRRALVVVTAMLVVALWVNQQAHASLLMSGPRPPLQLSAD